VVATTVSRLKTDATGYEAFLVELGPSSPGRVVVQYQDDNDGPPLKWELEVDPKWKAPRVVKSTPIVSHDRTPPGWSEPADMHHIRFSGAAQGYVVRTAASKTALADDTTTVSTYLPHSLAAFYPRYRANGQGANLPLGHDACFGETYRFRGPAWVEVRVLLPDGSQQLVTAEPFQIEFIVSTERRPTSDVGHPPADPK
jgi:hypothetical protein